MNCNTHYIRSSTSVIRIHSLKAAMQTGTGIAAPQSIGDPRTYLFPHWKQCSSPGNNPAVPVLRSPGTHVLSPAWRQSDTFPQSTVLGCSLLSPQALLYTSLRFATSFSILFRRGLRMRACTARSPADYPGGWSRWLHSNAAAWLRQPWLQATSRLG